MKNQAAANPDQFGYSNASSGRWRRPAGGASAGLSSDGANSFSVARDKDVNSAFNPVRPSMMFHTMYSGGGVVNQPVDEHSEEDPHSKT